MQRLKRKSREESKLTDDQKTVSGVASKTSLVYTECRISKQAMVHPQSGKEAKMKKAVCIGINNYPGTANDLLGCVNDANDWSALLQGLGFTTSIMLDSQATRQNVKAALQDLVTNAAAEDVVVFTYSGHGTQVLDTSGDETDLYDEAIYVYDGTIVDDELRTIIKTINPGALLVVVSDSCFSGTVTRVAPGPSARPRYMPMGFKPGGRVRKQFLYPEADMLEILISGCSDKEYSYDADINGRYNGAMTAMAISVIKQNPQATYAEFYAGLRTLLPSSEYPQTPQLEGSDSHKAGELFAPLSEPPTPPPPPPPPEPPTGCLQGLFQRLKSFWKRLFKKTK
jgi:metacaspase-1